MLAKSAIKIGILFFAVVLTGCAESESKIFARIDFTSAVYPEVVSKITGLSSQAPWGRWSDADIAPSVEIHFRTTLPKKFILAIKGTTLRDHNSATIKVGKFEEKVLLSDQKKETVEVFVNNEEPSQIIAITPESPVSPKELGLNEDTRKLGIGFVEIAILED